MEELTYFKEKFNNVATVNAVNKADILKDTISLYDVYQTFLYEYQAFKDNLATINNPHLTSLLDSLTLIANYSSHNFQLLTLKDIEDNIQNITFANGELRLDSDKIVQNPDMAWTVINFYKDNQSFLTAYQKLINCFLFGRLYTTIFVTISKSSFTKLDKMSFLFGTETRDNKDVFDFELSLEKKDLLKVKKAIVSSQKYALCRSDALYLMKECYINTDYLPDLFKDLNLRRKK